MTTANSHLLGGVLFVLAGFLVLANIQPVWWSIASVLSVSAAAAVMFGRAVLESRRARSEP